MIELGINYTIRAIVSKLKCIFEEFSKFSTKWGYDYLTYVPYYPPHIIRLQLFQIFIFIFSKLEFQIQLAQIHTTDFARQMESQWLQSTSFVLTLFVL